MKTIYRIIFILLILFQISAIFYFLFRNRNFTNFIKYKENTKSSTITTTINSNHPTIYIPSYFNETLTLVEQGISPLPEISFEKMLARYQEYHQQVLENTIYTSDCFSSNSQHQFVVFKAHAYSGYGNIIMGLFSTFLYALLSNRVFLVYWPGNEVGCMASLEQLLVDPIFLNQPWNTLDWNFFKVRDKSINFGKCNPEKWREIEKNWFHLESTVDHKASIPSYRYFKCCKGFLIQQFNSNHNIEEIKNNDEKLCKQVNSKDWIEIEAAQYFAPTIYADNEVYYHLFTKFEKKNKDWEILSPLYHINIFEKLAKYLFQPIPFIKEKVEQFKLTMFKEKMKNPKETYLIGVQIRKNEREWLFHNTPINIYWNCLKNLILNLQDKKYKKIIVFLTSDYLPAFQMAKIEFDKNVEFKNVELVYLPQNIPKTRSVEAVQYALIDLFLMMECDDLIMSEKSTFGHIIHGTTGIIPLVVRKEGRFANNNAQCIRAFNSEPWFHLRGRSNAEKCE
ncbi:hypothetical protein ABK040_007613 [Willaertia magna]